MIRVAHDRSDEPVLDRDGDADVHAMETPDRVAFPRRVALGYAAQRERDGLDDEIVDADLAAIAEEVGEGVTSLAPGDHVVIPDDAYGGTFRLFDKVARPWGLEHTPVHLADVDAVRAAMRPGETKLVWVETPTNPLLSIGDIEALAGIAHEAGALLVVDNTFASPYLQQPLRLGADVVVHSTTKYVGGHSDVVGGALVARDAARKETLAFHQNSAGTSNSPFDSFLTLRGLRTLHLRMARHCENAAAVADFLSRHPKVRDASSP